MGRREDRQSRRGTVALGRLVGVGILFGRGIVLWWEIEIEIEETRLRMVGRGEIQ